MRKATRIVAATCGLVAGLAGLEHGYFEILQGNRRPAGLMFPSMGPPCMPDVAWNACEPAMSILPSLLAAGILTVALGLAMMVWSAVFVQRKHGGVVLVLLSVALLLSGGGLFPPLIGLVGGAAGTRMQKPVSGAPGAVTRLAARLWPWPLVILVTWLLGQFPVGYLANDLLKRFMGLALLLILTMLPLSVWCAYARDATGSSRRD